MKTIEEIISDVISVYIREELNQCSNYLEEGLGDNAEKLTNQITAKIMKDLVSVCRLNGTVTLSIQAKEEHDMTAADDTTSL
jgi:hypothetical protein